MKAFVTLMTLLCFCGAPEALAAEPTQLLAKRKRRKKRSKKRRKRRRSSKAARVKAAKEAKAAEAAKAAKAAEAAKAAKAAKAAEAAKAAKAAEAAKAAKAAKAAEAAKAVAELEEERPGVAVFDLKAHHGVEPSLAALLSEILLTRVGASGEFGSVIGGSDIREMLSADEQKHALGCEDDSCAAELGGALGVPLLISPSIGKLGDTFMLGLKVSDVEEAAVKVRLSAEVASEGELKAAFDQLVDQMFTELFGEAVPEVAVAPVKVGGGASRLAGYGLAGVGVVAIGAALSVHGDAVSAFEAEQSLSNYEGAVEDTRTANQLLGAGVSSAALGAALLWMGR